MPSGAVQWSKKMFAIFVDDVLDMRIARAILKYQSVMTHMYWLRWSVFGNGPNISIAIKSRGSDAGKS